MTADDFFTGLFSGLAIRGFTTLSLRDDAFDRAVERSFKHLTKAAEMGDLNLRFRIRRHPVYGDSAVVRDSITNAVKRDLISLDNPVFQDIRLKLTRREAEYYLASIPGGRALFEELAEEFLNASGLKAKRNESPSQKSPQKLRVLSSNIT